VPPSAPEALLSPDHPDIRKLTLQIVDIEAKVNINDANARVAQGKLLLLVRPRLDDRNWIAWIRDELPFAPRTAQRFMQLARWAADNTALFGKLARLGSSKLNLLIALDLPALHELLQTQPHRIPGTKRQRTIDEMTVGELFLVLLERAGATAADPTTQQALASYRRRIRGLVEATDAFLVHRQLVAKDDAATLHRQLLMAAKKLARAFRLSL
jgi:hypothetical protein